MQLREWRERAGESACVEKKIRVIETASERVKL